MNSTTTVQSRSEEGAVRLTPGPDSPNSPEPDEETDADAARGDELSDDELFHLLQNSRRRAVIRYLEGREEPVRMRDVAEQVAAWEHDTTVEQLTSDERQRVYIALYQSHLDTLADAGVINYNKPRGVVEPRPVLEAVASYTDTELRTTDEADDEDGDEDGDEGDDSDTWGHRYLGGSVAGALLLVGSTVGVAGFGTLSNFAVSVLILAIFSVLTVARLLDEGAEGD